MCTRVRNHPKTTLKKYSKYFVLYLYAYDNVTRNIARRAYCVTATVVA